jgi:threonyl-tRNA synthetase
MTKEIMGRFGFKYRYRLSTSDKAHPEKYLGDPKIWAKVEAWAEKIMKRNKIDYFDGPGEAAFYAPKMDLIATDSLGREWQLSTVQIDYFLPERFNLVYNDKDGKEKRPIMIHRAIIGSAERMMMILLEHYAGAFPVWLAPVQVVFIPIAERHVASAQKMAETLRVHGIRVDVDDKSEPMGAKIRSATLQKVPYMGIIGDKEVAEKCISVRTRKGEDLKAMSLENFLSLLQKEIEHTV